MTSFEWAMIALTGSSVLFVPLLIAAVRGLRKWTSTEIKLEDLVGKVTELVEDAKESRAELATEMQKAHTEIYQQQRIDRDATDKRLRFMEEWFMGQGLKSTKM